MRTLDLCRIWVERNAASVQRLTAGLGIRGRQDGLGVQRGLQGTLAKLFAELQEVRKGGHCGEGRGVPSGPVNSSSRCLRDLRRGKRRPAEVDDFCESYVSHSQKKTSNLQVKGSIKLDIIQRNSEIEKVAFHLGRSALFSSWYVNTKIEVPSP